MAKFTRPAKVFKDPKSVARLVRTLYWGQLEKPKDGRMWLSARRISTLTGVPVRKVKPLVEGADPETLLGASQEARARHLTTEMVDWLVSPATLEKWRPFGVRDRCRLFEEAHPGKKLSYHGLRRLYQRHGISLRKLQVKVELSPSQRTHQSFLRRKCFPRVLELAAKDMPIWSVDEAVFTTT